MIVCESDDERNAFPIAHVDNQDLLMNAARDAIQVRRAQADMLAAFDSNLATIAKEDANRLERVLCVLIPELATAPPPAPIM